MIVYATGQMVGLCWSLPPIRCGEAHGELSALYSSKGAYRGEQGWLRPVCWRYTTPRVLAAIHPIELVVLVATGN